MTPDSWVRSGMSLFWTREGGAGPGPGQHRYQRLGTAAAGSARRSAPPRLRAWLPLAVALLLLTLSLGTLGLVTVSAGGRTEPESSQSDAGIGLFAESDDSGPAALRQRTPATDEQQEQPEERAVALSADVRPAREGAEEPEADAREERKVERAGTPPRLPDGHQPVETYVQLGALSQPAKDHAPDPSGNSPVDAQD